VREAHVAAGGIAVPPAGSRFGQRGFRDQWSG